jgi:hypothetical protein
MNEKKEEANRDIGIYEAVSPRKRGKWGHRQLRAHAFQWENDLWGRPFQAQRSFSSSRIINRTQRTRTMEKDRFKNIVLCSQTQNLLNKRYRE